MKLVLKNLMASILTPVCWTLFAIILLCIPGSTFPSEGIFIEIPHIDKVVHIVLFGGMVVLWSFYFLYRIQKRLSWQLTIITIVSLTIILGICMEYVQFNFVSNRAFDKGDILANTISSIVAGTLFYFKKWQKYQY